MRIVDGSPLTDSELTHLDAYWRAANYLSVGQIYLMGNPLLREPLDPQHVKPRLLGHWGTTPGLNILYTHLSRIIAARGQEVIYVTGPGHGGPGLVANAWLDGTYSEVYPTGLQRLSAAWSGCSPSSRSPAASRRTSRRRRPGRSTRAASSATPCPTRTAPRSTTPISWSPASSATARPRPARWRRPGTRTSSSTRSATARCCRSCISTATRSPTRRCWPASATTSSTALLTGYGYRPYLVEGDDPAAVHQLLAATLDTGLRRDRRDPAARPGRGGHQRPRWPMIVLRTPKGWTGPKVVDGLQVEGTWRAHQVPLSAARDDAAHLAQLVDVDASYRPEELFDEARRTARRGRRLAADRANCG